nr:phospholipase D family protein [uncultured Draconibacterium sp.]
MAEFLTTFGISYRIETIIMDAKKHLTLVSPYLQLSKTFYERLKDASKRKVKITIIYGKDELKPNERNSLAELDNVELFYFENLHAKCYFNETEMVITSMNMYEFSEKNNREMGVHITKLKDSDLYEKAFNEASSIIQSSEIIQLNKTNRQLKRTTISQDSSSNTKEDNKPKRGYCIRCETRIPYDIEKPYCWDCFATWAQFENPDYEENVCHSCGEFGEYTMVKPVCYNCYKKYEK